MKANVQARGFVFIAVSLDGFIARSDGSIDWLGEPDPTGEDYGYAAFYDSMDALVMGRKTWQQVSSFEQYPYAGKPVHVLSSHAPLKPLPLASQAETSCMTPPQLMSTMSQRGCRRVYIDGGNTIQRFLAHGLIDEIILTTLPLLIGSGIPLFGELNRDIPCRLLEQSAFENGFVQTRYQILPPA